MHKKTLFSVGRWIGLVCILTALVLPTSARASSFAEYTDWAVCALRDAVGLEQPCTLAFPGAWQSRTQTAQVIAALDDDPVTTATPSIAQGTTTHATTSEPVRIDSPVVEQHITQPVIERTYHTTEVVRESGVTQEQFDATINALRQDVARYSSAPSTYDDTHLWRTISLLNTSDAQTIQTLSLSGNTLTISDGNSVDLSGLAGTTYTASSGLTISGTNIQPDTGYALPLTASTTEWSTAYAWGDHGTAGYLTTLTGQSITTLSDVYDSMTPTDGQILTYDTTNGWQAEDAVQASQWTTTGDDVYYTTGNVGIGDTSPSTKLSVNGAITLASTTPATTTNALYNQGGTLYFNGTEVGGGSGGGSGGLESVQVFTSSDTWTKPAGVTHVQVFVTGGGGSGSNNKGGGAGATAIKLIDVSSIATSSITVGAGGESPYKHAISHGAASVWSDGTNTVTGGRGRYTGDGGTASGGDVNISGGRGNGITGGGSYWGGVGGDFRVLDAVIYGSGGGSKSDPDDYGDGADGIVIVYEYSGTAGADLAEFYETDGSATEGDIVALSDETFTYTDAAGNEETMAILTKATDPDQLFGVVSTKPGLFLGKELVAQSFNAQPIALAGRIPVKVTTEGGPIAIGDRITLSSTPGVGRKAAFAEPTIGRALAPFSGDAQGTVLVFVDPQEGIDMDVLLGVQRGESVGGDALFSNFSTLSQQMVAWLADTQNGIAELMAHTIRGSRIEARDVLCVGETCVTETQLKSLLSSASVPAVDAGEPVSAPTITPLGNNPAEIPLNATYSDMGATATNPDGADLSITTYVDGTEVTQVSIDTSTSTTHTITYEATWEDQTVTAERTVIIGDGATTTPSQDTPDTTATATATSTADTATTTEDIVEPELVEDPEPIVEEEEAQETAPDEQHTATTTATTTATSTDDTATTTEGVVE